MRPQAWDASQGDVPVRSLGADNRVGPGPTACRATPLPCLPSRKALVLGQSPASVPTRWPWGLRARAQWPAPPPSFWWLRSDPSHFRKGPGTPGSHPWPWPVQQSAPPASSPRDPHPPRLHKWHLCHLAKWPGLRGGPRASPVLMALRPARAPLGQCPGGLTCESPQPSSRQAPSRVPGPSLLHTSVCVGCAPRPGRQRSCAS